jgi:hypothetical protein
MKPIICSLKRSGFSTFVLFLGLFCVVLVLAKAPTGKQQFIADSVPNSIARKVSVPTPNYTITSTTGASLVPGTNDIGLYADDGTRNISLPFPFALYDQVFTSANVSSNGTLQFVSNNAAYSNDCLTDTNFSYTIFPFWDDLYTADSASGEGVFTSVSGTAPNRIFNIEWRTVYCCTGGVPINNFEVRLYEGQRKFDVIYGTPMTDRASATVGVEADDATHFTQYECNAGGAVFSGLQLTFQIPATCAPAPAGMIAWWKGEGDAKDSQGNHDGTNNGATFTPGEVGNAFTFNGTNASVSIPDSLDWNFGTGDFTFDFWENSSSTTREHALSFEPNQDVNNLEFDFNDNFGLWLYWNSGGGPVGTNAIQVGNVGDYTNGLWHHFALTRSGSTFTLYIDGTNVGTATDAESINLSGGNSNFIGAVLGSHLWNGQIDEVEVYNRALTSTEVASIFIAGSQGKCPCVAPPAGLVSWWPGDGGADDIVNGNDGTLQGGVSFVPGEVRQAFGFDGSSGKVTIPDSANIDSADFTYDAWVAVDPASPSGDNYIICKGAVSQYYPLIFIQGNAGQHYWRVTLNGSAADLFGPPNSVTYGYQHIAVTRQGTVGQLYIDGKLVDTETVGTGTGSGFPLALGNISNFNSNYFNGKMDEVEYFNRALTADEIASIFNAGGAGKCRSCVPAPGGLISWWKGDGDARDAQANNPGTFNGTAAFGTGKVGQAFSFDGNLANYVFVPPNASLDLNQFTVDAWIFPTSNNAGVIVDKEDNNGINYLLAFEANGGVEVDFHPTGGNHEFFDAPPGSAPPNQWTHIAGTYNGSPNNLLSLYVNGVLVGTHTATSGQPPSGAPTYIGERNNSTLSFQGLIDEVQVFGRALTDAEVHKIYDGGHDGKCPCVTAPNNLVSWWPGDGNANDIEDGNNGTFVNGPSFATGEVGQGFSLNGTNQYVEIPESANLDITGAITVDAWIKVDDFSNQPQIVSKYNNNDSSERSWALGISTSGHIQWGVQNGHNGSVYRYADTPNPIPTGVWMHVAGTFDPNTQDVKVYINGVDSLAALEAGSSTVNSIGLGPNTPVEIGWLFNGPANNYFFKGIIDEVELFNRALTADEIQSIYHAAAAGKCANLINVSASPPAGGTVSGGGKHATGSTATVVATANNCYQFVNWTEGNNVVSTSSSYTFTVTADRNLVANFSLNQYTISASASPAAGGSVSGAGTYDCGSTVELTATANNCYQFINWTEGSTVVSTSQTYSFTASANRTLVANFMFSRSACKPIPTPTPTPTATPTPSPTPTPSHAATQVDGTGSIVGPHGNQASFRLDCKLQSGKKTGITGSLSYSDSASGIFFASTRVTTLTFNGNSAHIAGTGRNNRQNVSFTVDVTDNGSPGNNDFFSIHLSNGYSASGNLVSGDLSVQ